MPDGRIKFICSGCGKCQMSEYIRSPRKQKESSPCRHQITFALDRHARAGLVEYVQAMRSTDAQAVRAIFQYVLTGKVFFHTCVVSGRPTRPVRVPRDPQAAATKFPNLVRELALKQQDRSGGYRGRGFQSLVLSVGRVSVNLDDAAKEGLVYAMNRLEMNHVDAARWLLANVRIPGAEPAVPLRTIPAPAFGAATNSGRRISSYRPGRSDPNWNDD